VSWKLAFTYLASGTKANLEQSVHAISHDLALGPCNHPKNDNSSAALLPRNVLVSAWRRFAQRLARHNCMKHTTHCTPAIVF
jgi:hypothetical protein